MKFLFVASGRNAPSTRFRIEPFLPGLRARGHRCDVAYSFPEKYDYFPWLGWRLSQRIKRWVRYWHVLRAKVIGYDAIWIEREVFDDDTWILEQRFRGVTNRLILDVDDAVFLRHPEKFAKIAEMSDLVIAGNRFLQEFVTPIGNEVAVIPTCISLADYQPKKTRAADSVPVIGWIGTPHNVAFLSIVAPVLRKLAQRTTFRLLVVSSVDDQLRQLDLAGVDVEFRVWAPETELDDLHAMDIGLMPLPGGQEWMKYKCACKLLQYLAVGVPGIASPIGVNSEILGDGHAGRLATTEQDWESAIEELLADEALRNRLGQAGRNRVRDDFSVEGHVANVERLLTGRK